MPPFLAVQTGDTIAAGEPEISSADFPTPEHPVRGPVAAAHLVQRLKDMFITRISDRLFVVADALILHMEAAMYLAQIERVTSFIGKVLESRKTTSGGISSESMLEMRAELTTALLSSTRQGDGFYLSRTLDAQARHALVDMIQVAGIFPPRELEQLRWHIDDLCTAGTVVMRSSVFRDAQRISEVLRHEHLHGVLQKLELENASEYQTIKEGIGAFWSLLRQSKNWQGEDGELFEYEEALQITFKEAGYPDIKGNIQEFFIYISDGLVRAQQEGEGALFCQSLGSQSVSVFAAVGFAAEARKLPEFQALDRMLACCKSLLRDAAETVSGQMKDLETLGLLPFVGSPEI